MQKVSTDNESGGSNLDLFIVKKREYVKGMDEYILSREIIDKLNEVEVCKPMLENDKDELLEYEMKEITVFEAKSLTKLALEILNSRNPFKSELISISIKGLMDKILLNNDIVHLLNRIRILDDYTFEHSVNVCVLSLIVGHILNYDRRRLLDLGVGAILHDVGKLIVDEAIIKKPSKLLDSEFEEIKMHTYYGFLLLKNSKMISKESANIAFSHHERFDGSGYPQNLKGDNITKDSRIVAICDVYDALTTDRVYRYKMQPAQAVEYITSKSVYHYDKKILNLFLDFLSIYPKGTEVMLNTKEFGYVIKTNFMLPSKPTVKVFRDITDTKSKNYEIDLNDRDDIEITSVKYM